YPEHLRAADGLAPKSQPDAVSTEEQHLAAQLIDAASKPLVWSEYRDDSAEQLRALIEAKLQGQTVAAPAVEETPVLQLVDALKRSVAQAMQQPHVRQPQQNDCVQDNVAPTPSEGKKRRKTPCRKTPCRRSA